MENNLNRQNIKDQELDQVSGGRVINITTRGKKPKDNESPKIINSNGLKPYRCEVCGKWIEATQLWHVCE